MDFLCAAEAGGEAAGGGYWHLALILAGIGFCGLFARWRKAKRPPAPDTRELRARDEEPNRYRDAADRAIVELLETSRELTAQVDTKIRLLNRLVKDAEEQAARLEKVLAESRAPGAAEAPAPPLSAFVSELQERIVRMRGEGRTVAEIARATSLSTTEVRFAIESLGRRE